MFPANISYCYSTDSILFCTDKQTCTIHTQSGECSQTLQHSWIRPWLVHQINVLAIHLHLVSPCGLHHLKTTLVAQSLSQNLLHKSLWALCAMIQRVVGGQLMHQREDGPGVKSLRLNCKMIGGSLYNREVMTYTAETVNISAANISALACLQRSHQGGTETLSRRGGKLRLKEYSTLEPTCSPRIIS